MIVGFGIRIIPTAVTVTNLSTKNDLPIYSVNLEEPKVSLSFDAAWTNEDMSKILEILDRCKVKATFFMTGEWVEKYPKDVKAIAAAGHDLGNHSENHKQMSDLPKKECEEEIMMAHNRVKELTGIEMKLFRAPYGDYNNKIVGTARECGYFTIQWNVDSLDWKDYGVDSILDRTVDNRKLGNGSILLFHVGTKYTAEALEKIIVGLQQKGYEIVPVSKLIYTGDYKVDQMGRQIEK
jgi:polysaccharide deacetylase family sporulation protein PdaB